MTHPHKLRPSDLKHPKDVRSSFTGDKIRPDTDQGFMKAKRVHSVEETRPPTNMKGVDIASLDSAPTASTRDLTGCKPIPAGHCFDVAFRPDTSALKKHQEQMLWDKKKKRT